MKHYTCHQWPFYDLGKGVQFADGRFSTDDPGQQKIIESNDKYEVFIWPVSPPAEKIEVKEEVVEMVHDKASEGGLSAPQQNDWEALGAGTQNQRRSGGEGREASPVLQELEELVRGSGIIGVEGKAGLGKAGKRR